MTAHEPEAKYNEHDNTHHHDNRQQNDASDEEIFEEEGLIIDDFNAGLTRLRPARGTKSTKCDCGALCATVTDFFRSCFQRCGLCIPSASSSSSSLASEAPPKRYLYWGPAYDQRNEAGQTLIQTPHLEHESASESHFVSNYISTTKYTIFTFVPLNLLEQFMKKANLYFLVIATLSFTDLSPKSPIFSVAPLSFVLAVSAVKEAYEDYKRYEMDKEINNRKVDVCRPHALTALETDPTPAPPPTQAQSKNGLQTGGHKWQFYPKTWQEIEVGDVVRITKNAGAFPADMLLLQSSTNQGLCNIETSNLDGETNLKIKQAVGATYSIETDAMGDAFVFNPKLQFLLQSEAPHEDIQKWTGALYFAEQKNVAVAVGINQFILRGCTLRNTDWIIAMVVFTGTESKISLNNKSSNFKRSNVDRVVDQALYAIFFAQACMCLFGVFAHLVWLEGNATNQWYQYIDAKGNPETNYGYQSFLNYFTFMVLLDLFVPISLYVSMELVKFSQAALINFDEDMVGGDFADEEEADAGSTTPSTSPKELNILTESQEEKANSDNSGAPPKKKAAKKTEPTTKVYAQARTSNLNEELGQVSYIFSDKTGTLTENKMEFLRCHIGSTRYGPGEMEIQHDFVDRVATPAGMPPFDVQKCQFVDNRLARRAQTDIMVNEFLTLLSVCHSIIPEYPDGPKGPISYNASSPDEKALVVLAKNLHYYFFRSDIAILEYGNHTLDGNKFLVNVYGREHSFIIYNMLEFSSKRKRMSVIVRDPRDDKIKLYCKGADNVIYQRLTEKWKTSNLWAKTLESLQVFAADGLRTLVCAYREIPEDVYEQWLDKLMVAKSSMVNRKALVANCYLEIEEGFTLLGATAIEDKLQAGVPSTIYNLSNAGISIWVLTGDKVETAINIGRSCRLLTPRMNKEDRSLYVIDPDERMPFDECALFVNKHLSEAFDFLSDKELNDANQGFVISGKALSHVFPHRKHDSKGKEIPPSDEQLKEEMRLQESLFNILTKCRAVVCCRVSPMQKAQIVELVKFNCKGVITLAIGDGANDVPMIRAAHVGIGISGQEGLQAVMSSDYAIAQFRFLQQLLLVHGAWDYRRISTLILYSFYKNIMFSMTQIWFSFYCGFSGTLYYDQLSGSCYNLVFTALPVLMAAVLDRPYSKSIATVCPELYAAGPANSCFNLRIFGLYCMQGVMHSMILFFTATFFIDSTSISETGVTVGFWTAATTQFSTLVSVATLKMMLETSTWTNWSLLVFFVSEILWFVFALVWSALPQSLGFGNASIYGVAQTAMRLPQYWFVLVLGIVLCLMPEILFKYIRRMYWPTRLNVIEELEMYAPKKNQFLAEIRSHMQQSKQDNKEAHKEEVAQTSHTTHLGFSDFQIGVDHPDYIMPQQKYMTLALKKPRLSNIGHMLSRKKSSKKSSDNKTNNNAKAMSGIQEQEPGK